VGTELATERQVGTDELNLEAGKGRAPLAAVSTLYAPLAMGRLSAHAMSYCCVKLCVFVRGASQMA
jgi:hypothetical protein